MPQLETYSTQKILQSIKQPVGRKFINRTKGIGGTIAATGDVAKAGKLGRFWQDGPGYDRNVVDLRTVFYMGKYIHNNPVRKGLVATPEDWYWSSARCWAEIDEGPLRVDKESMPER